MSALIELPVVALRDTVIFPGATALVRVGRSPSREAIRRAVADHEGRVFVVAQTDHDEEVSPDRLHTVGAIAHIEQMQRIPDRHLQVVLEGERRAVAVRYREQPEHLTATLREVEQIPPLDPEEPAFIGMQREVRERAVELAETAGVPAPLARGLLEGSEDDPGRLADVIASYLDLPTDKKQELLETLSIEERLRRVLSHVQREIRVAQAQNDIKDRVEKELGDRQREAILREQLRAIHQELGEGEDGEEIDQLRERLAALELPEEARREVDRDLHRLDRLNRESAEYQVLRTALETVAELPWNERTETTLDIARAERILDEDHHGLGDVKDRILEYLAVLGLQTEVEAAAGTAKPEAAADTATSGQLAATEASDGTEAPEATGDRGAPARETPRAGRGPILLFVGPPGVGKTSIARSIARALGREYVRMSLGGARDEADIRGHRRTYVGAMPGRIIKALRQAGTKNPVLLLDEVDKLGVSYQGDPAAALLEVLDPAQNDSFVDHYIGVPFDLSEVLFVATANLLQGIPGPLLDRMEVVQFTGYTEAEKLAIARRYLLPRQLRDAALRPEQLEVTDAAIARVIAHYTRESGVRQLERELGKVARKVARRVAAGETGPVRVDAGEVAAYLGREKAHPERAHGEDQVGVATGMYYTPVGGDIMFVEATTMRGKGNLALTGQLGDVMKESAQAVFGYARSRAGQLLIDEEMFDRDLHVHVPAGAIPKDGPSAGVALATAMVSALTGVPARGDTAMTGEVTLTGRVLPIGGVKEKVLGAVRAGIRRIILPRQNEAHLEDLPREVRDELEVILVDSLDEVLEAGLRGGILRTAGVRG